MRWKGIFETPNVAGLEICVAACALVYLASRLNGDARSMRLLPGSLLFGLMTCLALLLSATQSRAAICAFLAVPLFFSACNVISFRTCIALTITSACALFLSSGLDRFPGTGSDASVSNRFILWERVLSIIRDHSIYGVGSDFEPLLNDWYLEKPHIGKYATALSEPLHLWAICGGLMFFICVAAVAFLVLIGFSSSRISGHHRAALGAGILLCHGWCGLFQAHLFSGYIFVYVSFFLGCCLSLSSLSSAQLVARHACFGIVCGVSATALVTLMTMIARPSFWRTEYVESHIVASKRSSELSGIALISLANGYSPDARASWSKVLADRGYAVCIEPDPHVVPSIVRKLSLSQRNPTEIAVYASGENASILFREFIQGSLKVGNLILKNPIGLPKDADIQTGIHGSVFVTVAGSAPFVDAEDCSQYFGKFPFAKVNIVKGRHAKWWNE
jgi:hypothetical protein